ncbi:MAG: hypothetical protein HQL71_00400 [Magnetococcales bacterium]|nr:hypothetical protein [Magnetococcales bacterium]
MIPPFNKDGNLPKGVHIATWEEFEKRFAINPDREYLLYYLKKASSALAKAGSAKIFIDGSFVTDCGIPGDYDMCWQAENVDPNLLDPMFLDVISPRQTMKDKYRGDIFPETYGSQSMLDYFQEDREGRKKGVVELNPSYCHD